MSRQKLTQTHPVRPKTEGKSEVDRDVDASDGEDMAEDGEKMEAAGEDPVSAEEECEAQGQGEPVKVVRDPSTPTAAERKAHECTHWPYRSWCDHCVRSRGLGQPHRKVKPEDKESTVPRTMMDYGFIKEEQTTTEDEHGASTVAKVCMTILVMIETLCDSVWAYAIEGKGAASTDWLAPKVVDDMNTIGMTKERVISKSDQEPAIVQLQHEVARLRKDAGTAIENSRVGDSNSNGAVERAVREVKGMTRTLRSHLEEKIRKKIKLDDPIVPWIVRHAAYLITRCRVGPDGKTAMQKLKGRRVITPLLPFGEVVLFKLPKVPNMPGDFQDRFETGIWLGSLIRSGEHLVGTADGVYTVSQIMRCSEDKKWSSELVDGLKGTPREPVPGSGRKLHAYAKSKEDTEVNPPKFEPRGFDELPEVRVFQINRKDLEQNGGTPGCPGCRAMLTPGSQYRAKHTPECRARFEGLLSQTEEGARRLERASAREERLTREIAEKGETIMQEQDEKEQKEKKEEPVPQEEASGSGLSQEQRERELRDQRKQEVGDQEMGEGEWGPHGTEAPMTPTRVSVPESPPHADSPLGMDVNDDTTLEEAPPKPHDIRVALGKRTPAVKRERAEAQSGDTPEREAKWMTVEDDGDVSTAEEDPLEDDLNKAFDEFLAKFPGPGPNSAGLDSAEAATAPVAAPNEDVRKHPGPKTKRHEVEKRELQWQDIGSGTFARTFLGVKRLITTTRGGPPLCDVHRRTIWSLTTGRVIDDCFVDDVPDTVLHREMATEDDIRIELTMKGAMAMYERKGADVVELFSQPRIAQAATARLYGGTPLQPGWSLDLTRLDPKTGRPWDLSDKKVQSRVMRMIAEGKPLFVIGSPPCTAFSTIQNLNSKKRDPKIIQAEKAAGERHMEFSMQVYKMQIRGKRFFVHEHPVGASSWKMQSMVELLAEDEVDVVSVDMCAFGMTTTVDGKEMPVLKRTRIASNSHEVLKRVGVKCANQGGVGEKHTHASLEGGRTKLAQVYPKKFCQAVCEGIAAQKRLHALGLEAKTLMTDEEMAAVLNNVELDDDGENPSEALHEEELKIAFDDQSGEPLIPGKVREARKEEIAYFREREVYEKVSLDECWRMTGCAPIGVKWVDINKGDTQNANYRSRLVAMEFRREEKPEWYAATPPSECLKIVLSMMASDRKKKMLYADVSRAYFYARAARPVYVKLPEEDRMPGDENMCGKLKVSMYGTRDAASNWANEYGETLKKAGYQQGVTNPCLFWHPGKEVAIMVHGDDFVAIGSDEQLAETQKTLADKYKIKVEKLGADAGDVKEVRVLNKVIRYTSEGLELEADPRHAELVVRDLEVEGSKTFRTPGVKVENKQVMKGSDDEQEDDKEDPPMGSKDATRYRAIVARLNYMAADRLDIQYAVKEVARNMSTPRQSHWSALRRIGLYLQGRPRLVMKYPWQKSLSMAVTYTDSDWAGCRKTGKSTSGGIVTIGGHIIKSYSRQQRTVALSSAEAELHAMVAASAETIGVINLCKDMGMKIGGEVYADSSAAIGIAQRSGSGKVRHIRVQALWVQEVRSTGRLAYHKVLGSRNPADVLTKHVPAELLNVHLKTLGLEVREGRAETAPTLDSVEAWTIAWTKGGQERKEVRFSKVVQMVEIPASGKCRRTSGAKKTRTSRRKLGRVPGGDEEVGPEKERWADIEDDDNLEVQLAECNAKWDKSSNSNGVVAN